MSSLSGLLKEGRYIPLPILSEDQAQYLVENNDIIIRLINEKFAAAIEDIRKEVIGSAKNHIDDLIAQALEDKGARDFRDQIKTLKSISSNDELQRMLPMERLSYAASRYGEAPIGGVWKALINGVIDNGYEADVEEEPLVVQNLVAQLNGYTNEGDTLISQCLATKSDDCTGDEIAQAQRDESAGHTGDEDIQDQTEQLRSMYQTKEVRNTKGQRRAARYAEKYQEAQALLGSSERGRGIIEVLSWKDKTRSRVAFTCWKRFKALYCLIPEHDLRELCHRVNDECLKRLEKTNAKKNKNSCHSQVQSIDFINAATKLQVWLKKRSKPSYIPKVPTTEFLLTWKIGYHSCGLLWDNKPQCMQFNDSFDDEKSMPGFSNDKKRALLADSSTEEQVLSKEKHQGKKSQDIKQEV